MSDDQRPPQVVKSYAGGIAARNAERQQARRESPTLPNLGQAAVTYDPKLGPQTLQQLGEAQRADAVGEEPAGAQLSPGVVEGLRAIHSAAQAQGAASQAPPPGPLTPPATSSASAAVPPDEELDPIDEEFVSALRRSKEDVIQNERERAAVALRVAPIELGSGLLTGAFTQDVPIVPGKLEVKFRCLTPMENNELRILLYEDIQADRRKDRLVQELLSIYQTTATTMSINKTVFADHLAYDGSFGGASFQTQIFRQKLAQFMSFPIPLVVAISTHSAWFEMRVRDLFTTADKLKNG